MSTEVHVQPDDAAAAPPPAASVFRYTFGVSPTGFRPGTAWIFHELFGDNRLSREFTSEAFEAFRAQVLADGFRLRDIRRSLAAPTEAIE